MSAGTISCRRCGREDAPKLDRPPFKNELGERLFAGICADCWKDWLKHQTSLINHYGLDPREQEGHPQERAEDPDRPRHLDPAIGEGLRSSAIRNAAPVGAAGENDAVLTPTA